jgi:hypothetical protein
MEVEENGENIWKKAKDDVENHNKRLFCVTMVSLTRNRFEMLKKLNVTEEPNVAVDVQRIDNTFGDSFRYGMLTFVLIQQH